MKKILLFLSCLLIMSGCTSVKRNFVPGTYKGIAQGYLNTVEVAVTVDEHYILEIELLHSDDPEILLMPVLEELPQKVIKKNSTDVDGVTGATYTSESLLKAIDAALDQAIQDE